MPQFWIFPIWTLLLCITWFLIDQHPELLISQMLLHAIIHIRHGLKLLIFPDWLRELLLEPSVLEYVKLIFFGLSYIKYSLTHWDTLLPIFINNHFWFFFILYKIFSTIVGFLFVRFVIVKLFCKIYDKCYGDVIFSKFGDYLDIKYAKLKIWYPKYKIKFLSFFDKIKKLIKK